MIKLCMRFAGCDILALGSQVSECDADSHIGYVFYACIVTICVGIM